MARRRRNRSTASEALITKMILLLLSVLLLYLVVSAGVEALGPTGLRITGGLLVVGACAWVWWHLRSKRVQRKQQRARELVQAERDTQLANADVMTGTQFEHLVARLLARDGFTSVRVAGGAGDRGADVFAQNARGQRVVVQCKRYKPNRAVSSPEMQLFVGMAWREHHAEVPLYVTTAGYTKEARNIAAKHGIHLVGRAELGRWMSDSSGLHTPATFAAR